MGMASPVSDSQHTAIHINTRSQRNNERRMCVERHIKPRQFRTAVIGAWNGAFKKSDKKTHAVHDGPQLSLDS